MFERSTARLYWARFENAYYLYAFTLVKAGRVPASREVVLAEARESVGDVEASVGVELSYPELDLPAIRVVRNPNDSLGWRPWVALGFPGEGNPFARESAFRGGYLGCATAAQSRGACVRKARARLYGIALAKSEEPVEVTL